MIALRDIQEEDLEVLFRFQKDVDTAWKTGGSRDPRDWKAFRDKKLESIGGDPTKVATFVVEAHAEPVGSAGYFYRDGVLEIMYWLGPDFRGRGLGTLAVEKLLESMDTRFQEPIYARVVEGNDGSARVLEKLGFQFVRKGTFFSKFLGRDMTELVYRRQF